MVTILRIWPYLQGVYVGYPKDSLAKALGI